MADVRYEKARNGNLIEWFKNNGYEIKSVGKETHIKGFGGLYIKNDEPNVWNRFSTNQGSRNAIDCLTYVLGVDFKTALVELSGEKYSYQKKTYTNNYKYNSVVPIINKPFVAPTPSDRNNNVFAYLINTRKINKDIVIDLVQRGLLYQDNKGNAVFLHKDINGNSIGAEFQGTNTYKRFKGIATGTRDSAFIYVKGNNPKEVFAFESAIDMMSYVQLHKEIKSAMFVSLAGLKPKPLQELMQFGYKVISCVDNDVAGQVFNRSLALQTKLSSMKDTTFSINTDKDNNLVYANIKYNNKNMLAFVSQEDYNIFRNKNPQAKETCVLLKASEKFIINQELQGTNCKDWNERLQSLSNKPISNTIKR